MTQTLPDIFSGGMPTVMGRHSSAVAPMLESLADSLPAINRDMENFGKTQSQYMDVMLTVSHPTPIRNLRQISAEMNKVQAAMREAGFNLRKKDIEARMFERDARMERDKLPIERDDLKAELLDVQANELRSQIAASEMYIVGAVRKLKNYADQYNAILQSIGKTELTEADFEAEESRYHVMKAFQQAVCAAHARNGMIDEGNFIYLQQIGIPGALAQKHVSDYIAKERQAIGAAMRQKDDGGAVLLVEELPTHEMLTAFLNQMADLYATRAEQLCKARGMSLTNTTAMLRLEAKGE